MKMKNLLSIFIMFLIVLSISAKEAVWKDNFETAKQEAKTNNKYIFLNFSGSDWCGWCIKLNDEVLSKDAFLKYADDNLVLMVADFPRIKKLDAKTTHQNELLAQKYSVQGFPTVVILNSNGELVEKTGYMRGGPEAYIKHVKDIISKYESGKKS